MNQVDWNPSAYEGTTHQRRYLRRGDGQERKGGSRGELAGGTEWLRKQGPWRLCAGNRPEQLTRTT